MDWKAAEERRRVLPPQITRMQSSKSTTRNAELETRNSELFAHETHETTRKSDGFFNHRWTQMDTDQTDEPI